MANEPQELPDDLLEIHCLYARVVDGIRLNAQANGPMPYKMIEAAASLVGAQFFLNQIRELASNGNVKAQALFPFIAQAREAALMTVLTCCIETAGPAELNLIHGAYHEAMLVCVEALTQQQGGPVGIDMAEECMPQSIVPASVPYQKIIDPREHRN
jgi:hypothetical protein